MNNELIYRQLGELTGETRQLNARVAEVIDELRRHTEDDRKAHARIDQLESDRDRITGTLKAIKWIGGVVVTVATFIGAEKLAVLLGMTKLIG